MSVYEYIDHYKGDPPLLQSPEKRYFIREILSAFGSGALRCSSSQVASLCLCNLISLLCAN